MAGPTIRTKILLVLKAHIMSVLLVDGRNRLSTTTNFKFENNKLWLCEEENTSRNNHVFSLKLNRD